MGIPGIVGAISETRKSDAEQFLIADIDATSVVERSVEHAGTSVDIGAQLPEWYSSAFRADGLDADKISSETVHAQFTRTVELGKYSVSLPRNYTADAEPAIEVLWGPSQMYGDFRVGITVEFASFADWVNTGSEQLFTFEVAGAFQIYLLKKKGDANQNEFYKSGAAGTTVDFVDGDTYRLEFIRSGSSISFFVNGVWLGSEAYALDSVTELGFRFDSLCASGTGESGNNTAVITDLTIESDCTVGSRAIPESCTNDLSTPNRLFQDTANDDGTVTQTSDGMIHSVADGSQRTIIPLPGLEGNFDISVDAILRTWGVGHTKLSVVFSDGSSMWIRRYNTGSGENADVYDGAPSLLPGFSANRVTMRLHRTQGIIYFHVNEELGDLGANALRPEYLFIETFSGLDGGLPSPIEVEYQKFTLDAGNHIGSSVWPAAMSDDFTKYATVLDRFKWKNTVGTTPENVWAVADGVHRMTGGDVTDKGYESSAYFKQDEDYDVVVDLDMKPDWFISKGGGALDPIRNSSKVQLECPGHVGLVGHWRLDETAAGPVVDSGPYGLDGTNNGATINQTGQLNKAYTFNNAYVAVGPQPELKLTKAITICAWVKINTWNTNWGGIAGWLFDSGSNESGYCLNIQTNGTIQFGLSTGTMTYVSSSTLSTGVWYHVAGVYDGVTTTLYVNAANPQSQGKTGDIDWTWDAGYGFEIGRYRDDNEDNRLDGDIDDVRIYNRALSAVELADVMTDSHVPTPYEPSTTLISSADRVFGEEHVKVDGFEIISKPSGGSYGFFVNMRSATQVVRVGYALVPSENASPGHYADYDGTWASVISASEVDNYWTYRNTSRNNTNARYDGNVIGSPISTFTEDPVHLEIEMYNNTPEDFVVRFTDCVLNDLDNDDPDLWFPINQGYIMGALEITLPYNRLRLEPLVQAAFVTAVAEGWACEWLKGIFKISRRYDPITGHSEMTWYHNDVEIHSEKDANCGNPGTVSIVAHGNNKSNVDRRVVIDVHSVDISSTRRPISTISDVETKAMHFAGADRLASYEYDGEFGGSETYGIDVLLRLAATPSPSATILEHYYDSNDYGLVRINSDLTISLVNANGATPVVVSTTRSIVLNRVTHIQVRSLDIGTFIAIDGVYEKVSETNEKWGGVWGESYQGGLNDASNYFVGWMYYIHIYQCNESVIPDFIPDETYRNEKYITTTMYRRDGETEEGLLRVAYPVGGPIGTGPYPVRVVDDPNDFVAWKNDADSSSEIIDGRFHVRVIDNAIYDRYLSLHFGDNILCNAFTARIHGLTVDTWPGSDDFVAGITWSPRLGNDNTFGYGSVGGVQGHVLVNDGLFVAVASEPAEVYEIQRIGTTITLKADGIEVFPAITGMSSDLYSVGVDAMRGEIGGGEIELSYDYHEAFNDDAEFDGEALHMLWPEYHERYIPELQTTPRRGLIDLGLKQVNYSYMARFRSIHDRYIYVPGHDSIGFGGSNDYYESDVMIVDGDEVTIAIVVNVASLANSRQQIWTQTLSLGGTKDIGIGVTDEGKVYANINGTELATAAGVVVVDQPLLIVVEHSLIAQQTQILVNGVQKHLSGASFLYQKAGDKTTVGAAYPLADYFNGQILRMRFFNKVFNSTERGYLTESLMSEYGIS